jgi:hypothetical protein
MTAGAILDFTHRSALALLPGFAALGISCFIIAAAYAQNVTLTNSEHSSDNPATSSADWSEPPPLSEPSSDEVDFPLPVSRSEAALAVAGEEGGAASAVPRKFHYKVHVTVRGVYDDNIELSNTNRSSDYYFAIEPGITLGYGDIVGHEGNYIRFDYEPSIFLFVDHDEANAVNHIIRLEGYHSFGRLAMTLDQDIQLLEGANLNTTTDGLSNVGIIDAGGRNAVNLYTTRLGATYDLSGKTFLSGGLDYSIWDYQDTLISSEYLSGNLFINYNYSPKLVIGLGGSGGYNWVDSPSPNQTFEQANVRMSYQATGKISLSASGGVEFRQFENDTRGTHVSPVYELSATYQPFDGTNITLSGSGRILNSAALAGQDYMATTINAAVRQRLLGRIYLGLTLGYEHAEYFDAINGVNATREDNYYFIQPTVDLTVTRWWTAGVYFLHREDDSSTENFSFYDNQIGVRTAFEF